jgi:hypothetical protein
MTANKDQAIQFAPKVVRRAERRDEKPGIATVNEYDFDLGAAIQALSLKQFGKADEEWLDYVVDNRKGSGKAGDYDIVIGPVANDDVFEVIGYYEDGVYTKEMALEKLKIKKLFNKYVFKSEAAIDTLIFIRSWQV